MQIDCADLTFAKKMIFDFYGPRIGLALGLILRD
jgi:hypothetical protein